MREERKGVGEEREVGRKKLSEGGNDEDTVKNKKGGTFGCSEEEGLSTEHPHIDR